MSDTPPSAPSRRWSGMRASNQVSPKTRLSCSVSGNEPVNVVRVPSRAITEKEPTRGKDPSPAPPASAGNATGRPSTSMPFSCVDIRISMKAARKAGRFVNDAVNEKAAEPSGCAAISCSARPPACGSSASSVRRAAVASLRRILNAPLRYCARQPSDGTMRTPTCVCPMRNAPSSANETPCGRSAAPANMPIATTAHSPSRFMKLLLYSLIPSKRWPRAASVKPSRIVNGLSPKFTVTRTPFANALCCTRRSGVSQR